LRRAPLALGVLVAGLAGPAACARPTPPPRAARPLLPPPSPAFCEAQRARPNFEVLSVAVGSAPPRLDPAAPIVLARYDGCKLEILPQSACTGSGAYHWVKQTPGIDGQSEVLHDALELSVRAPVLAAGMVETGFGLHASEGIGIAVARNGYWEGDRALVTRDALQGDPACIAQATHFVRQISVGAYEAYRDDMKSLEVRAQVPMFGASVSTSQKNSAFARAGSFEACFKGNTAMCEAPVALTLSPIAAAGTRATCPPGEEAGPDGRCAPPRPDPVSHRYLFSVGVQGGSCGDVVGDCDYRVRVLVGEMELATLEGPHNSRVMAPEMLRYTFSPSDLERGVVVKLWDKDPLKDDWLGECVVRRTEADLQGYIERAQKGTPAATEEMACGDRTVLMRFEPAMR
jgi:hypothetical protein